MSGSAEFTGSGWVQHFVQGDELHVARDPGGMWWAVGKEGSYGGSRNRLDVIAIAKDASASTKQGRRRIVVHYVGGTVQGVITRTTVRPTPQFFQDDVP